MKISIEKPDSRGFSVKIPALWAFGRFGAIFIRIISGVRIKGRDLVRLRRIIRRYRRQDPNWTVVEIKSAKNARIMIKL